MVSCLDFSWRYFPPRLRFYGALRPPRIACFPPRLRLFRYTSLPAWIDYLAICSPLLDATSFVSGPSAFHVYGACLLWTGFVISTCLPSLKQYHYGGRLLESDWLCFAALSFFHTSFSAYACYLPLSAPCWRPENRPLLFFSYPCSLHYSFFRLK